MGSVRPGTGLPPKSSSTCRSPRCALRAAGAPPSCGKIWKVTLCPACGYYRGLFSRSCGEIGTVLAVKSPNQSLFHRNLYWGSLLRNLGWGFRFTVELERWFSAYCEVGMVCPYCGAELADEARFCVGCGAALDGTQAMPVANPAAAPVPVGSPVPSKKPKKGVVIAIVCAAVIVVSGGGGLAYHRSAHVQEQEQYQSAHSKRALVVNVKAEGWDTDNGASRVPVCVKGKTVDGKKVDKVEYVASDGSGIKLIQGKYTLKAAGSPIAADGTIPTRCLAQRPSSRSTTLLLRARRSTWQNSPSRIRFWTLRPSMLST